MMRKDVDERAGQFSRLALGGAGLRRWWIVVRLVCIWLVFQ
jgi:hypothetical protein